MRRILTHNGTYMHSFGAILIAVAASYLALLGLLYAFQGQLVYFPMREIVATPRDRGLDFEDVYLETEDGVRLHGWFVPAAPERAVLLYFHGNAGNLSYRVERTKVFHDLGLSVLALDYRGYGRSAGRPSEEGTYRDARAAWRYLAETRRIAPDRIVLFGRSLGAAVAAQLAVEVAPRALILDSAFTSAVDLGAAVYPWLPVRLLARYRYPTLENLKQVNRPVLIVHSRNDEIVPFRHGEALYAAANPPKVFLEIAGGHNDDFFVRDRRYADGLDAFLAEVLKSARP